MINDKIKIKVIFRIDYLVKKLGGTIYELELKSLRKKYIYKDISDEEYIRDKNYLMDLKKITE